MLVRGPSKVIISVSLELLEATEAMMELSVLESVMETATGESRFSLEEMSVVSCKYFVTP